MFSRYYGIYITKVRESLAYRFHYIVRILASFISLFIIWYIWKAIYASATGAMIGGFEFSQMMTYMCLSVIFSAFFMTFQEHEIEREVQSGSIAIYLTKPVTYPIVCFFKTIGTKSTGLFIQVLPLIIVAFGVIRISAPVHWIFLLSLSMSYLINYVLVFLTGLTAFWTRGGIWGIRLSRIILGSIFSGSLLPLVMFPNWLANIANVLPFITIFHIPASIYLGRIVGAEILTSLLLQTLWLMLLVSLSVIIWKRASKKIFIQGG